MAKLHEHLLQPTSQRMAWQAAGGYATEEPLGQ